MSAAQRSIKQGTPTDEELEELGEKIASKWIKLGRRLLINNETLQEICQAHEELSEKGYHMLMHWREKQGSAATYQALCNALQHKLVLRQDLAEQFCYIKDETFEIQLPAGPAPEEIETEEALGATGCKHGTSVALRKDREDSSTVRALKIRIDVETMKPAEHNTQVQTLVSTTQSVRSPDGKHQKASAVSGHTQPLSTAAEGLQAPNLIPTEEELFRLIVSNYLQTTPPKCMDDHNNFLAYIKEIRSIVTGVKVGSLVITVKCDSLEALEKLWGNFRSGHLGEVIQRCFVTEEILTELSLSEVKLKTTILEEDYEAYKVYFKKESAREEKVSMKADDGKLKTKTEEDDSPSDDESTHDVVRHFPKGKSSSGSYDSGISSSSSHWSSKASSDSGISSSSSSGRFSKGSYDSGISSSSSSHTDAEVLQRLLLRPVTWRDKMHQIARWGLKKFDVSSPQGLQDYMTYLTDNIYNAGQEAPSMKNLTESMNDIELKELVAIHVRESKWQVVVLLLNELLVRKQPPVSIMSVSDREDWETDKDMESDDSEVRTLTWWPTDKDKNLVTLCQVLTEGDCRLKSLKLSHCREMADEEVNHLAEALMHSNCTLNSLTLSSNGRLTDEGVKHLAEALMHTNCTLNSLKLIGNGRVTDEGVKHLAEALMHSNCILNSLSLSGNGRITDEGVKHLAGASKHSNCSLHCLDLSRNQAITDEGVKHLAEVLKHSNYSLNSLNLCRNYRITDEGVKHLAEALKQSNCSLNCLDLRWTHGITDEGVKHLAEALTHSTCSLKSLYLRGNNAITDEGVKHLAEALKHKNCSLNNLDLSWNHAITDEGVKHLAEALKHINCSLKSLDLSVNKAITNEGVKQLAEALEDSNCILKT